MRGQEPGSEHDRRAADSSAAPAAPPPSFGQTDSQDVPPAFPRTHGAAEAEPRPAAPVFGDSPTAPPPGAQPWEVPADDTYDWYADPTNPPAIVDGVIGATAQAGTTDPSGANGPRPGGPVGTDGLIGAGDPIGPGGLIGADRPTGADGLIATDGPYTSTDPSATAVHHTQAVTAPAPQLISPQNPTAPPTHPDAPHFHTSGTPAHPHAFGSPAPGASPAPPGSGHAFAGPPPLGAPSGPHPSAHPHDTAVPPAYAHGTAVPPEHQAATDPHGTAVHPASPYGPGHSAPGPAGYPDASSTADPTAPHPGAFGAPTAQGHPGAQGAHQQPWNDQNPHGRPWGRQSHHEQPWNHQNQHGRPRNQQSNQDQPPHAQPWDGQGQGHGQHWNGPAPGQGQPWDGRQHGQRWEGQGHGQQPGHWTGQPVVPGAPPWEPPPAFTAAAAGMPVWPVPVSDPTALPPWPAATGELVAEPDEPNRLPPFDPNATNPEGMTRPARSHPTDNGPQPPAHGPAHAGPGTSAPNEPAPGAPDDTRPVPASDLGALHPNADHGRATQPDQGPHPATPNTGHPHTAHGTTHPHAAQGTPHTDAGHTAAHPDIAHVGSAHGTAPVDGIPTPPDPPGGHRPDAVPGDHLGPATDPTAQAVEAVSQPAPEHQEAAQPYEEAVPGVLAAPVDQLEHTALTTPHQRPEDLGTQPFAVEDDTPGAAHGAPQGTAHDATQEPAHGATHDTAPDATPDTEATPDGTPTPPHEPGDVPVWPPTPPAGEKLPDLPFAKDTWGQKPPMNLPVPRQGTPMFPPGAFKQPPFQTPPPPPPPPKSKRALFVTLGALALAGVATGGFFAYQAVSAQGPSTAAAGLPSASQPPASAEAAPSADAPSTSALDSEQSDPQKMALSEAFPKKKVTASGATFTRVKATLETSCDKAATGAFATALKEHGCSRVLRATYVDGKRRYAVTTGIAVFPDKDSASAADQAKDLSRNVWFRPLPGAEGSGSEKVHIAGGYAAGLAWGRYIVFSYATHADGRTPGSDEKTLPEVSGAFRDETSLVLERRATSD
ncbi:hypothetical protein [Nonomuraea maritima]|uniref:hypothetical protein n=1 Tax=Nonomuraea maritima TaxID=683260 RepID=UPI00371D136F